MVLLPMSCITTPEASKSTSTRRKGKKDVEDVTPTTELNPDESISKSKRKTKVEEKVEEETVIDKVPKDTKTPATPIRRSRRISGATPVLTPVLQTRGRRISGALNKTATETPTIPETRESQFDTLELRNRDVVETLSLTENFGKNQVEEVDDKPKRKGRRKSNLDSPDISTALANEASPKESSVRKSSRSSRKVDQDTSSTESPKSETPKKSNRSSRKTDLVSEEASSKTPTTPEKPSALPKHLTPLKHATPLKDDASLTPTRRTRRVSSGDIGSGEPLTPVRRSRRLSGAAADVSSAPDGGIITGATPRRTPRGRRHNTSVRAEDVESALALAQGSSTPLPTLVEEEPETSREEEEAPKRGRGRPKAKPSTPSLNVISEENDEPAEAVLEPEPSKQPSKSRGKRKPDDDEGEEISTPPAKRVSRRVTITTLDTDVDLFTPLRGSSTATERRKSTTSVGGNTKKYIPVKKKTSVRIK